MSEMIVATPSRRTDQSYPAAQRDQFSPRLSPAIPRFGGNIEEWGSMQQDRPAMSLMPSATNLSAEATSIKEKAIADLEIELLAQRDI